MESASIESKTIELLCMVQCGIKSRPAFEQRVILLHVPFPCALYPWAATLMRKADTNSRSCVVKDDVNPY